MNLGRLKPDDVVQINKRGRLFDARIKLIHPNEVEIEPLDKRVNYFRATAREVVKKKSNQPNAGGPR